MDGVCQPLSGYINSSQCLATNGGAEINLFLGLLYTLVDANLRLGDPNDYPPDSSNQLLDEYDFIVIGSGAAGSVVASRLSEIEDWNVLLIEAGGDPTPTTEVPGLYITLQNTDIDWQYRTTPNDNSCLGLENQQCKWPRGKVLGGSTTINTFLYVRGNKLDYDSWEEMGNTGWNYDDVLPYFKKSEGNRNEELVEEHSDGIYYHSADGPLSVEWMHTFAHEEYFRNAVTELGYDLVLDINGPSQLGFSHFQATLLNATRCNAAKAFLSPIRNRKNLHVSKYSQAMKINIDPETKKALSVQFRTRDGRTLDVRFRKEVVVSGGSINSPQILMLSGIGPKEHLEELGIDVLQDLQVGKNLQDHLRFIGSVFTLNNHTDFETPTQAHNDAIYNYLTKRQGAYSSLANTFSGFIRSSYADNESPDLQFHVFILSVGDYFGLQAYANGSGLTEDTVKSLEAMIEEKDVLIMAPTLLHPKSIGEILLNSSDPFEKPIIYDRYLTNDTDIKVLLEGIQFTSDFMNTKSMQSDGMTREKLYVQGCEDQEFDSESYWRCMLKHVGTTVYHPAGTCKMGPSSDLKAVVDPELKVHGVQGIRIVDASILPNVVSGNINAAVIMIGEKGSDLIKKDWLAQDVSTTAHS